MAWCLGVPTRDIGVLFGAGRNLILQKSKGILLISQLRRGTCTQKVETHGGETPPPCCGFARTASLLRSPCIHL